jgi:hypothetical protein
MSSIPGSFTAQLYETAGSPLLVSSFIQNANTPGNVAVCLCGGGSRALSAGMGVLQALENVTLSDGSSLLSHVKALSRVSGGSWLGAPFVYLNAATTDDAYLNAYIDPGKLTVGGLRTLPT